MKKVLGMAAALVAVVFGFIGSASAQLSVDIATEIGTASGSIAAGMSPILSLGFGLFVIGCLVSLLVIYVRKLRRG